MGGGKWDDLMNWAVNAILTQPLHTFVEPGLKACYTAPIQIIQNGKVVSTFYPTVIISTNNRVIITAYPGGKCGLK